MKNVNSSARAIRLLEVEKLLRRKPYTARALSEKLKITKPTAYANVKDLAMRGCKIKMTRVREGAHGPESVAYQIAV